jgi:hypothetical protein
MQNPYTTALVLLVLTAGSATRAQRSDVFQRVDASTDIAWLERVVDEPGLAESSVPSSYAPKLLRQTAYIRLGVIGSAESIAAIHRIEESARQSSIIPPQFTLGRSPHPSGHFTDWTTSLAASIAADDGTTFGVIRAELLGGSDLFLTSTRTPRDPAGWSRPLLVPDSRVADTMNDVSVAWENPGRLVFRYVAPPARPVDPKARMIPLPIGGPQEIHIVIADVTVDRDGDGWTDVEERRLHLRPDVADSDGDGVPDGADVSPQYAPSPTEGADVEVAILARTVFAGYGLTGAHTVLLADGTSRPLQLWGLTSPMLFGIDRSSWIATFGGGPPLVHWKLTSLTATDAVVKIGDFEGALAAAGYTARLRLINGEWIVVSYKMDWIS